MSSNTSIGVPNISIGMPVYNGEKTIEAALDCVVKQTFRDFELIISDNASTDGTEAICRKYALKDSRIRYVRQHVNIGAVKNFHFVLNEAQAKYFMWATSDDVKSFDFLEINYFFLVGNLDYVASTCPTRFEGDVFNSKSMGDESLDDELPERFKKYFNCWHANGRFCSLMRREAITNSIYLSQDFFGSDWATMLSVIAIGKTYRHNKGYVVLGKDGFSNSGNIFKYYRKKNIHWILPFYELILATCEMMKSFSIKNKIYISYYLVKLNFQAVRQLIRGEMKRLLVR